MPLRVATDGRQIILKTRSEGRPVLDERSETLLVLTRLTRVCRLGSNLRSDKTESTCFGRTHRKIRVLLSRIDWLLPEAATLILLGPKRERRADDLDSLRHCEGEGEEEEKERQQQEGGGTE